MKLTFLGTGAADWCLAIREGKKVTRRYSSVIIDDELVIDSGPGVLDALKENKIEFSSVKYVLNTHDHDDHMNRDNLKVLTNCGAQFINTEKPGVYKFGKYTVEAVKANHAISCVHFLISDGESVLFYGLDGAWITYEEYEAIQRQKVDLGVFDATIGFVDGDVRIFEHNNLNMVIEMKKTLCANIDKFCISHMAYTLHDDHEKLSRDMKKYDIDVAYDGMTIEF